MRVWNYLIDKATKLNSIVSALKKPRFISKALIPVALASIVGSLPPRQANAQNYNPTSIERLVEDENFSFSSAYELEPLGEDWLKPAELKLGYDSIGLLGMFSSTSLLHEQSLTGVPLLTGALKTAGFSFASEGVQAGYEEIEKSEIEGYSGLEAAVIERKQKSDDFLGIRRPTPDIFGAGKLTSRKYWVGAGDLKFNFLDDVAGGRQYLGIAYGTNFAFQQTPDLDTLSLNFGDIKGSWREGIVATDAQKRPLTGHELSLLFNSGTDHALSLTERDVGAVLDRSLAYGSDFALGFRQGLLRGSSQGTQYSFRHGDLNLGYYSDDLDLREITFALQNLSLMHRSQPDMQTFFCKQGGRSYTLNLNDDYTRLYFQQPGAISRLGIGTDLLLVGYAGNNFKAYYCREGDTPDIIKLSTRFFSYDESLVSGAEQRALQIPGLGLGFVSNPSGDLVKYEGRKIIASAYLGDADTIYQFRLKGSPYQFGYSEVNGPMFLYGSGPVSIGYANGNLSASLDWQPADWVSMRLLAPQNGKPQMAMISISLEDYLKLQLRGSAPGLVEFNPVGIEARLKLGKYGEAAYIWDAERADYQTTFSVVYKAVSEKSYMVDLIINMRDGNSRDEEWLGLVSAGFEF